MSSYGWLQLGVLVALVLVSTPLLGAYMAGVFGGRRAGRPPVPAGGARALPPPRRRSHAEQRVDHLRALAPRLQPRLGAGPLPAAERSRACCRSTRPTCRRAARAGVQHRGQLRHQHELAELRRRVDHESPHPDGRADGAELRLRRRGHRRRHRPRARARAPALGHDRELLGRPHADGHTDPPPARASSSRSSSQARRRPEPARADRATTAGGATQAILAAPSRARRRSRSSVRTAAVLKRELFAPVREPERAHEPAPDLAC